MGAPRAVLRAHLGCKPSVVPRDISLGCRGEKVPAPISLHSDELGCFPMACPSFLPTGSPRATPLSPSPSRVRRGNEVLLVPPHLGQLWAICACYTRGIPISGGTTRILERGGRKKQPEIDEGEALASGSAPCLWQPHLGGHSPMSTGSIPGCSPPGC